MALFNRKQKQLNKRSSSASSYIGLYLGGGEITVPGYRRLSDCPEILAGINKIASLIGSMTIHLMANTSDGDKRIKNALSEHIDIYPNKYQTRQTWMEAIVRDMLITGNCVCVPYTENGLLGDIIKCSPGSYYFETTRTGYTIRIGQQSYDPSDLLHFVVNPDPNRPWRGLGYQVPLAEIAKNLQQAAATERAFMSSEFKPSIIVKADTTEDFAGEEGRQRLINEYFSGQKQGAPWIIPADQFQVEQVKPLSLKDLAISETITLDKRTVASILGVPAFVLGVGDFNQTAWNNFIQSTILSLCTGIQQELTRKLILSDKWYFKFNIMSLYSYDIQSLATVYCMLYDRGLAYGDEVRDRLGLSPLGLKELRALENYIPADKAGDQKKLNPD